MLIDPKKRYYVKDTDTSQFKKVVVDDHGHQVDASVHKTNLKGYLQALTTLGYFSGDATIGVDLAQKNNPTMPDLVKTYANEESQKIPEQLTHEDCFMITSILHSQVIGSTDGSIIIGDKEYRVTSAQLAELESYRTYIEDLILKDILGEDSANMIISLLDKYNEKYRVNHKIDEDLRSWLYSSNAYDSSEAVNIIASRMLDSYQRFQLYEVYHERIRNERDQSKESPDQ